MLSLFTAAVCVHKHRSTHSITLVLDCEAPQESSHVALNSSYLLILITHFTTCKYSLSHSPTVGHICLIPGFVVFVILTSASGTVSEKPGKT